VIFGAIFFFFLFSFFLFLFPIHQKCSSTKGKERRDHHLLPKSEGKKKVAPSPRGTPSSLGSDSGGFFRSSPSVPFALSSYSQRPSSSSFSCSSSLTSSALSSHCLADEASFQSQSSSKTSALPRCTNCCQVLKECLVCKKCSYLFCPPCTMYLVHFGGLKCPKGRSHSFDLKKGKQDIAEVLSSSSSSLFFPTSPISSKTPSPLFLPFKFNNKQVDEILMFLVDEYDSATSSSSISSLYSSSSSSSFSTAKVPSSKPFGSENAIQLFLAAFANFDIDKELFFGALVTAFSANEKDRDFFGRERGPALKFILTLWLKQSGAVYEKQFPNFFRHVAKFVSNYKDDSMNAVKLILLKNKSDSQGNSSQQLYCSISEQLKERRPMPSDESLFQPKLFSYSAKELADAINFVLFRIYAKIGPSELHDGSWQGQNRPIKAPHLNLLSYVFNHISFLLIVEILFSKTLEERCKSLEMIIEVGYILEKMGNFEGMAAVSCVFSNACIQRLKPVWSGLNSKCVKRAKKLEKLIQPSKNYKLYKEGLSKATPPILPWVAPKLREMRYMYDGNSKIEEDGTINSYFLEKTAKSINEYLRYQSGFSTVPSPCQEIVQILENITLVDDELIEEKLYTRSRTVAPPLKVS